MAMASSLKIFSLLLLLLTLLSSLQVQIHARDSQFFNKIPSNTNTVNVNPKENEPFPTTKQEPLSRQQEQAQEPNFIPQSEDGGYGLYSHESGQFPPSTTTKAASFSTTYEPYKSGIYGETTEPYKTTATNLPYKPQSEMSEMPFSKDLPDNYNPTAYVTKPRVASTDNAETEFMDKGYTATTENENYNNNGGSRLTGSGYTTTPTSATAAATTTSAGDNYYSGGNRYYYNNNHHQQQRQQQQQGLSGENYNGNGMYNTQKQGMSDTRFLENGRYFYDLESEKYNGNPYGNSKSEYNTNNRLYNNNNRLYNSNNNRGYYGNNENSFEHNNSMGGFQNEDEFQEDQIEMEMP